METEQSQHELPACLAYSSPLKKSVLNEGNTKLSPWFRVHIMLYIPSASHCILAGWAEAMKVKTL